MNTITESVLIESRSARTFQLSNLSDERALETLNKAKALVMAVWQGTGIATNAQLAEYYEISEEAVQQAYHRNREEFKQNGVKVLKGKDLKLVVDTLSTTGNRIRSSLTIWNPRSAIGLGMMLQDSSVARQVRSVVLDIVEAANPEEQIDLPAQIAIIPKAKTLDELSYHDLRCLLAHSNPVFRQPFYADLSILAGIDPIFWATPWYCLQYLFAKLENKTDSLLAKHDLSEAICQITAEGSKSSDWDEQIQQTKTKIADRLQRQESILNSKVHQRAYQKFKAQLAEFQGQLV